MIACSKKLHQRKTISDWGQDCHSSTKWIKNMDMEKTARQEYLILQELDSYRKP
jgi:hypothetical protein